MNYRKILFSIMFCFSHVQMIRTAGALEGSFRGAEELGSLAELSMNALERPLTKEACSCLSLSRIQHIRDILQCQKFLFAADGDRVKALKSAFEQGDCSEGVVLFLCAGIPMGELSDQDLIHGAIKAPGNLGGIIELIKRDDIDLNLRINGLTLMHTAAGMAHALPYMQLLHSKGAQISERSDADFEPLYYAASCEAADIVDWLLEMGANKDSRSPGRKTPLHKAAEFGRTGCVQVLLKAGANPNAKDAQGRTPADVADRGKPELKELLQRAQGQQPRSFFKKLLRR